MKERNNPIKNPKIGKALFIKILFEKVGSEALTKM